MLKTIELKSFDYLKAGDKIALVAPGARCSDNELNKTRDILLQWGLEPVIPSDIFSKVNFCANTAEQRYKHLHEALYNPEIKAIWCLLGGYGSAHLIPYLKQLNIFPQQKIFIGISDITALHIFLQQEWGWSTIHGPCARQLGNDSINENSIAEIKNFIFGQITEINLPLFPLNQFAVNEQVIQGSLIGGNLSIIQTSIGTSWHIQADNKILLLEEVNERGYKIDRMLTHLSQAKIFENVKAIILGDFIKGFEKDGSTNVGLALQQFAQTANVPVLSCPGVGHDKINHTLPLGLPCELRLGENGLLHYRL